MQRGTTKSAATFRDPGQHSERASTYRRFCLCAAATAAFMACDGGSSGSGAPHATGEIPADAFDGVIVPTEGHRGWTQGAGDVTDDGAAIFDVPLPVPRGRHGIEPALTLHYHSRHGDGLVGNGWTIAGLSMITRCPRTRLIDEADAPVQFDPSDAFCLDGERLVEPPTDGFWGGGEYRLWRNGRQRITRTGAAGQEWSSFEVWQPDGTVWQYGRDEDAYIRGNRVNGFDPATGNPVLGASVTYAWLLSRVRDRHGNWMEFHYARSVNPDGTVETRPIEVTYTHRSGEAARRRVAFEYEDRPVGSASVVQWVAQFGMRTTKRLRRVVMTAPGTSVVRSFVLFHRPSIYTGSLLLYRIAECDGADRCREPLALEYQGGMDDGFEDLARSGEPEDFSYLLNTNLRDFVTSDANGNSGDLRPGPSPRGLAISYRSESRLSQSFVYLRTSPSIYANWRVLRERGPSPHGWFWDASTSSGFDLDDTDLAYDWHAISVDHDRNGEGEFLRFRWSASRTAAYWDLLDLEPDRSASGVTWRSSIVRSYLPVSCSTDQGLFLGDLDGDGVEDLIGACGSRWSARLHTGGPYGEYGSSIPLSLTNPAHSEEMHITEIDGDGRQEIVVPDGATFVTHGLDSTGTRVQRSIDLPAERRPIFLDANGDGLADILTIEPVGSSRSLPMIRMNIGDSRFAPARVALPSSDRDRWIWDDLVWDVSGAPRKRNDIRVADVNGDGREDFIALFNVRAQTCEEDPDPNCAPQVCDQEGARCIRAALGNGLALAHLSNGESFTTMRLGPAGTPHGAREDRRWPATQVLDLGADGLPDLIVAAYRGTCAEMGLPPRSPVCAGVEESGRFFHFVPNRFTRVPDLLQRVTHSSTATQSLARFEYAHTERQDQSGGGYPLRRASEGLHVVREYVDPLQRKQRHWYANPSYDLRDRSFLGFSDHFIVDEATGTRSVTHFDTTTMIPGAGVPFAHLPREQLAYTPLNGAADPPYRAVHTTFAYTVRSLSSRHHTVELRHRTTRTYELPAVDHFCLELAPEFPQSGCEEGCHVCNPLYVSIPDEPHLAPHEPPSGPPLTEHRTELSYDEQGSLVQMVEHTVGTQRDTLTIVPEHRETDWLIGLPARVEVRSEALTGETVTDVATRIFVQEFDGSGFLTRRVFEPEDPSSSHETVYAPNQYGLAATVTQRAAGLPDRVTEFIADPDEHIYPRAVVNALGHGETVAYHPGLGVIVYRRDPNGVETRMKYDGFGRPRRGSSTAAPNAIAELEYHYGSTSADRMDIHARMAGHGRSIRRIDALGRVAWEREWLPDGYVTTTFGYDGLGRLRELIGPKRDGEEPSLHRRVYYDGLDRPIYIDHFDGAPPERFKYEGLTTRYTDRRGGVTRTDYDALGRPVLRRQHVDGVPITVTRQFGAFGALRHISHSAGGEWWFQQDSYGRRTLVDDPDAGIRRFEYNRFGELARERDASGQLISESVRDALGRTVSRWTDEDGLTEYVWDTAENGIGRLARAVAGDPNRINTEFTFDESGRIAAVSQSDGGDEALEMEYSYDAYGRLDELRYPELFDSGHARYKVRYDYDATGTTGRVVRVSQSRPSPNENDWQTLWESGQYEPLGRVSSAVLGNGLTESRTYDGVTGRVTDLAVGEDIMNVHLAYDGEGNLIERRSGEEGAADHLERFEYDELNRLVEWRHRDLPIEVAGVGPVGRHEYDYDAHGNLIQNGAAELGGITQHFGEGGAGPHQLTSTSAGRTYMYDLRGRRSGDIGWPTESRVDAYTSAGLPRQIETSTGSAVLRYDAFGQRAKLEGTPYSRRYLRPYYDTGVGPLGVPESTFRVYVEGQLVAWTSENEAGERRTYHAHLDEQGSLIGKTDESGALERIRYLPHGQRYSALGPTDSFGLGYGAHWHEGFSDLIDMGGRIYEPGTGQFLTPDPIVRSTLSSEALNAYSYVENNPTSRADPTGLCPNGCRDEISFPPTIAGAAGFLVGLAVWLAQQSAHSSASGGGDYSSRSARHRSTRRDTPPAVAEAAGSRTGETHQAGGGIRQSGVLWNAVDGALHDVGRLYINVMAGNLSAITSSTVGAANAQRRGHTGTAVMTLIAPLISPSLPGILAGDTETEVSTTFLNDTGLTRTLGIDPQSGGYRISAVGGHVTMGIIMMAAGGGGAGGGGSGLTGTVGRGGGGGNFVRPLTAADLGVPANSIVDGTFALRNGKVTAFVRYLGAPEGGLGRGLLGARHSLANAARAEGANAFRIETTPIIEATGRLANILQRAGFQPRPNGTMWWEGAL